MTLYLLPLDRSTPLRLGALGALLLAGIAVLALGSPSNPLLSVEFLLLTVLPEFSPSLLKPRRRRERDVSAPSVS